MSTASGRGVPHIATRRTLIAVELPVMSADGDDVTRSAAGRHAGELLLAAPAAALGPQVSWRPVDGDRATARVLVGGDTHDVTLTIAADGALTALHLARWGNPDGEGFGAHGFGADLHGESTFDGFTIPREITAGWHYGTDRWPEGQFIRYTTEDARYRRAAASRRPGASLRSSRSPTVSAGRGGCRLSSAIASSSAVTAGPPTSPACWDPWSPPPSSSPGRKVVPAAAPGWRRWAGGRESDGGISHRSRRSDSWPWASPSSHPGPDFPPPRSSSATAAQAPASARSAWP